MYPCISLARCWWNTAIAVSSAQAQQFALLGMKKMKKQVRQIRPMCHKARRLWCNKYNYIFMILHFDQNFWGTYILSIDTMFRPPVREEAEKLGIWLENLEYFWNISPITDPRKSWNEGAYPVLNYLFCFKTLFLFREMMLKNDFFKGCFNTPRGTAISGCVETTLECFFFWRYLSFHQDFQVPKMEVLHLMLGHFGVGFSLT